MNNMLESYLARDMKANKDLLIVEQHAIDSLDSCFGGLIGLIVNESVALRVSLFIGGDLARENIAERGESIVESLG